MPSSVAHDTSYRVPASVFSAKSSSIIMTQSSASSSRFKSTCHEPCTSYRSQCIAADITSLPQVLGNLTSKGARTIFSETDFNFLLWPSPSTQYFEIFERTLILRSPAPANAVFKVFSWRGMVRGLGKLLSSLWLSVPRHEKTLNTEFAGAGERSIRARSKSSKY